MRPEEGNRMPVKAELMLVDLGSIAYPIWHLNVDDPDHNKTSKTIVKRILELTSRHKVAAICCDGQGSRDSRCKIDADYIRSAVVGALSGRLPDDFDARSIGDARIAGD